MDSLVAVRSIKSARDLFDYLLFGSFRTMAPRYLFRGLPSDKYELIPSALRPERQLDLIQMVSASKSGKISNFQNTAYYQQYIEFSLLKSFFHGCNEQGLPIPEISSIKKSIFHAGGVLMPFDTWIPNELFDLAALAQHFGLPTRLLDWTSDCLTALYFACLRSELEQDAENVVLWILNPYFIENLKWSENFPLNFIFPTYHINPNLNAQKGILTLWQEPSKDRDDSIDRRPLDVLLSDTLKDSTIPHFSDTLIMEKLLIPVSEIESIINVLTSLNYIEGKIFPGYHGVSMSITKNRTFGRYIPFA